MLGRLGRVRRWVKRHDRFEIAKEVGRWNGHNRYERYEGYEGRAIRKEGKLRRKLYEGRMKHGYDRRKEERKKGGSKDMKGRKEEKKL